MTNIESNRAPIEPDTGSLERDRLQMESEGKSAFPELPSFCINSTQSTICGVCYGNQSGVCECDRDETNQADEGRSNYDKSDGDKDDSSHSE